jgi:hypothetical protein
MTAPTRSLNDSDVAFFTLVYMAIFAMFSYAVGHGRGAVPPIYATSFITASVIQSAMLFRRKELPRRALWLARGWCAFWVIVTIWSMFF